MRRFETERSTDATVADARTIRSESTTRALSVEELRQQILSDLEFLAIPDHYLRTAFNLNIVAGFSLDHRLQFVSTNRVPVDARMKVRLDDYKTLLLSYEAMLSLRYQRGNQRGQSDFLKGLRATVLGVQELRQGDVKGAMGWWGTGRQLLERAEMDLPRDHRYVGGWPPALGR